MLGALGQIPEGLQTGLESADEETLKQWIKLAARAESIEGFWQRFRDRSQKVLSEQRIL